MCDRANITTDEKEKVTALIADKLYIGIELICREFNTDFDIKEICSEYSNDKGERTRFAYLFCTGIDINGEELCGAICVNEKYATIGLGTYEPYDDYYKILINDIYGDNYGDTRVLEDNIGLAIRSLEEVMRNLVYLDSNSLYQGMLILGNKVVDSWIETKYIPMVDILNLRDNISERIKDMDEMLNLNNSLANILYIDKNLQFHIRLINKDYSYMDIILFKCKEGNEENGIVFCYDFMTSAFTGKKVEFKTIELVDALTEMYGARVQMTKNRAKKEQIELVDVDDYLEQFARRAEEEY